MLLPQRMRGSTAATIYTQTLGPSSPEEGTVDRAEQMSASRELWRESP